jgi:hypothetical protein
MTKFLYGASVQGIQSFIFQTNKLKEIIGASEIIEDICTTFFEEKCPNYSEGNVYVKAAGTIRYIFDKKEDCEKHVLNFPKQVMEYAPGISISQAVVEIGDDESNPLQQLEDHLSIQKNRCTSILNGMGLMVFETARRTGGLGVDYKKTRKGENEVLDWAQQKKVQKAEQANNALFSKVHGARIKKESFPLDIEDMIKDEKNSWIAIVHADGNDLGSKIMNMAEMKLDAQHFLNVMKAFSKRLNDATVQAAKLAYENVILKDFKQGDSKVVAFRPVILGGDDLTAIIRGDLALEFTNEFLNAFEEKSKEHFNTFSEDLNLRVNPFSDGLTACAGIAYIKASYPFHYGVSLSEKLCKTAKEASKKFKSLDGLTPSSLMFHKVSASFVEEWDDIIDKELTGDGVRFDYGPYFIKPQNGYATIANLQHWIKEIGNKNAPKSGLRNWLSEVRVNKESAQQLFDRIFSLNKNAYFKKQLNLDTPFPQRATGQEFTHIYDFISLSNVYKK